jgi:hypothetical protein
MPIHSKGEDVVVPPASPSGELGQAPTVNVIERPVLSDYLDDLEHEIRNGGDVDMMRAKIVVFVTVNLGMVEAERDELVRALRKIVDALCSDAPTGPQKTISRDDTIYHLDGQKMYRAINDARDAITAATKGA